MDKYAVGVDIGGTKISTGIVSSEGEIIGNIVKIPTISQRQSELIIEDIINSVKKVIDSSNINLREITGIGIGSPGPLDAKKGILLNPPNLPTLHNFNLRDSIMSKLQIETNIDNDANVFVLGEACFGAGSNSRIVFGVTLGTGLGSGLVIDKRIYMGSTGTACEIWHCNYKEGIIEDYVSGKGIKRIYFEMTGKSAPEPVEIDALALKGDKNAIDSWKEFGKHLGIILSYVVNVVDPELIVIGGSLSKSYKFFSDEMEKVLRKNITDVPKEQLRVRLTQLGETAAVIGAACLVL